MRRNEHGAEKWLETEQSVSDILKLKPGLDFDQEEKEMRIQRIMNLAAFNGKKESIGFGNFLVRQISYTGWKIWLAQGIFVAVFWILFFGSRASDMAEIARLIGRNLPFFLWNDCSGAGHDFNSVSGEVFPVSDV